MSAIVVELQKEALDKNVQVSDLLRKALTVARKLKIGDIETWIQAELNGYSDDDEIPEYRIVTGQVKVYNPYNHMWLPVIFHESEAEIQESLSKRKCVQPIAVIENLIADRNKGILFMPYPPNVEATLMKAMELDLPPVVCISKSCLHGILDSVRTAVLDWALKLEEQGITGEDFTFSKEEKIAAANVVFNIGWMSNSQIQSGTIGSEQILHHGVDLKSAGDLLRQLQEIIPKLHLDASENSELESEIKTIEAQLKSPKPKSTIIRESFRSIRRILEGAAGSAIGSGLLNGISSLLGV